MDRDCTVGVDNVDEEGARGTFTKASIVGVLGENEDFITNVVVMKATTAIFGAVVGVNASLTLEADVVNVGQERDWHEHASTKDKGAW